MGFGESSDSSESGHFGDYGELVNLVNPATLVILVYMMILVNMVILENMVNLVILVILVILANVDKIAGVMSHKAYMHIYIKSGQIISGFLEHGCIGVMGVTEWSVDSGSHMHSENI